MHIILRNTHDLLLQTQNLSNTLTLDVTIVLDKCNYKDTTEISTVKLS